MTADVERLLRLFGLTEEEIETLKSGIPLLPVSFEPYVDPFEC